MKMRKVKTIISRKVNRHFWIGEPLTRSEEREMMAFFEEEHLRIRKGLRTGEIKPHKPYADE